MLHNKEDIAALGAPGGPESYLRLLHYALSALNAFVSVLVVLCTRVSPWVQTRWATRSIKIDGGAKLFSPAELTRNLRYFILPRWSPTDPLSGELQTESGSALFRDLDALLSDEGKSRYTFLLGDSGIGKTSAILSYYVRHLGKLRKP